MTEALPQQTKPQEAYQLPPDQAVDNVVPIHGPEANFKSLDSEVVTLPPVTIESIQAPEAGTFQAGDSIMVLQVNAKDNRDASKGEVGPLQPEAAAKEEEIADKFLSDLLDGLSEEDRAKVDVMVVASSADLVTLDGVSSDSKRAVDTAQHAMQGFRTALAKRGLSDEAVVNNRGMHSGEVFETESLQDVPFLHDEDMSAQDYAKAMVEKYGTGYQLWAAFEKDSGEDRAMREAHGVAGPEEIAEEVSRFVDISRAFVDAYREANPDRRLVIWAVGHYDSLSPYIKRDMLGQDVRESVLPMDKSSGVVIHNKASA